MSIEESDEYTELSSSDREELDMEEVSFFSTSMRVSTAPARPLTDIEEFRRSSNFLILERTVSYSSYLIMRSD
jgi:hypothetical protein